MPGHTLGLEKVNAVSKLTLVIADKNYSSWSLRPWLLMRHFGIAFDELLINFNDPDFKTKVLAYSPAGQVPILLVEDEPIWDSLAICEALADLFPHYAIWPHEIMARAHARAIAAQMHSGFVALRQAAPMNLRRTDVKGKGRGEGVTEDVERICTLWRHARERFASDGPFLFGNFCAADAFYAPIVTRFDTYGFSVDRTAQEYMNTILRLPAFIEWKEAALKEPWIVPQDEVD